MKKKFISIFLASFFLLLAFSGKAQADSSIYRLYNPTLKEHLFTADANEYNVLASRGWSQEGTAWYAPDGGSPVTRLYSKITHKHLYTTDSNEVAVLTSSGAWTRDAMSFYSGGSVPVYRLYHAGIKTHLLTTDANEYNTLAGAWNAEGVKLYATAVGQPKAASSNSGTSSQTGSGDLPFDPNRTVYITGGGESDVYWYSTAKMPPRTNLNNLQVTTEGDAVSRGKRHSETE
ncbi:hypothetical protein [Streptococcus loxodontisalivarius]|uniref:DUF5648 domain-containing protein n=1 Tax=Streptococcus loxodontisalivarius TaxID=1349415 RepID=A0ABS2PSJ5_9STRE|nr:hypothetical protein [Streptococcus loxodontisalivarius]MBM7642896.1 hypothetical protein [Streptococcus loxodontisalivarius]